MFCVFCRYKGKVQFLYQTERLGRYAEFFSAAEGRDRIADNNKILRAITGVTGVMLVAKLLAVLRNILQARVYGTGAEIDVFTQVNNYSVSLFTTIAYALCVAAVPLFSQRLLADRKQVFQTADRLISNPMLRWERARFCCC